MVRDHSAGARVLGIVFLAGVLASCSGEDSGDKQADRGAAQGGSAVAATTSHSCPLTAEQVSGAVGAPVKGPDSSCSFFHETKLLPSAAFVNQVAVACAENVPAEYGYTETIEGLGHVTHVGERADGVWLLVCRSGAPFEIRVDTGDSKVARTAAIALAREVLAAP